MKTAGISLLVLFLATLGACGPELPDASVPTPEPERLDITAILSEISEANAEVIAPSMYDSDIPRMTALLEEIAASNAELLARSERFAKESEALVAMIEARQTGAEPPQGHTEDCVRAAERSVNDDGAAE